MWAFLYLSSNNDVCSIQIPDSYHGGPFITPRYDFL